MKSTKRRLLTSAASLATAITLALGGFAVSASASEESVLPPIETVATEPVVETPIVEPAPAEEVTPDPAPSETVTPDPEPIEPEPIIEPEPAEPEAVETVPEEVPAPAPIVEPAPAEEVTPDPAPSETVTPESKPIETVPVPAPAPIIVEPPVEVPLIVVAEASLENFSAEAICVDPTNSQPGARASVDVVVPEGAAPAVVQFIRIRNSDGGVGFFSDPTTFVTSGTLTKTNTMRDGSYTIQVQLNGTTVGSIDVSVTQALCNPEPTPTPSIENFSAVAACVDAVHGRMPGAQINADVVVPEGAPSAVVTVIVNDQALGSNTFDVSGKLNSDPNLAPGNYAIGLDINGTKVGPINIMVTADLCDEPGPTPPVPPAPEPPVVPIPEPAPEPAPEPTHTAPPVVIDDGWGSNPPAESVSDDSSLQSLPNTGMSSASPGTGLGLGLVMLLAGAIVTTLLRRKSNSAK